MPLGSTRQLTNSAGAVTDSYLLDAFGNPVQSAGTTVVPYHFIVGGHEISARMVGVGRRTDHVLMAKNRRPVPTLARDATIFCAWDLTDSAVEVR